MGKILFMNAGDAVASLYERLIAGWNASDADGMAEAIAQDGLVVGFDGSQMVGRDAVATELGRIRRPLASTADYVTKVRSVRALGSDAGLLYAVAGMVPPVAAEIVPEQSSVQTVVAHRSDEDWTVALFQTTPAQPHGRPELSEALTRNWPSSSIAGSDP